MSLVIFYGIEFAIQTVLILAGLWIMIAVQKLNNNILGLIGTAALTSALEMILDRFVGIYFSTPLVIAVMLICIWKVTGSSNPFDVDVLFTVAVGGAVTFALNMFVIGALMGDLRPSADDEESNEIVAREMEEMEEKEKVAKLPAKLPSVATNQVVVVTSSPAPIIVKTPPPPAKVAMTAKPEKPSKLTDATRNSIKLKGLNSGGQPSVILSDGKRTFTLNLGESRSLSTADGMVVVKLVRVTADEAVVSLNGELLTLTLW